MSNPPMAAVVAAKALDGLSMRMAALAQNIANVNSHPYQPLSLPFENILRQAAAQGPDAVRQLDFGYQADRAFAPNDDRRIDLMLADAAETAQRYAAVVDMLGRRLSIQRAAVRAQ